MPHQPTLTKNCSDQNELDSLYRTRIPLVSILIVVGTIFGTTKIRNELSDITLATKYQQGRVISLEKKGLLFKSYEGKLLIDAMIPIDKENGIYTNRLAFSLTNEDLAKTIREYTSSHHDVSLTIEEKVGTQGFGEDSPNHVIAVSRRYNNY
jgi:hypothetical protein